MTGWHVTSNDIKNWTETNKRRAEETLPLLVKITNFSFLRPKGNKFLIWRCYWRVGWGGTIDVAEATKFIPEGKGSIG